MKTMKLALVPLALAALAGSAGAQQPQPPAANQPPPQPMSFFVTSVGKGDGANLGGLAGADAQGPNGIQHARDRIGRGPWFNAKGALIASNVDDLHQDRNNIRKPTALNEKGEEVNGVGNTPNMHDMLTGSDSTGRLVPGNVTLTTCNNWTSNSTGNAMLGHHDRLGGPNASWNSVHSSRSCSQEDLVATGGAGLFYCFAVQ
jgi:hypothetical protein